MPRIRMGIPTEFNLGSKLGMGTGLGNGVVIQNGFFGTKLTNGGGNWGTSLNRAMFSKFTLANTATLKKGFVYQLTGTAPVSSIKILVYSDNSNTVAGGSRLAVSSANLATFAGVGYQECLFNNEVLVPGVYWIGAVSNDNGGASEFGSSLSDGPFAVMYNGTLNFATPPATAPTLTGEPGPYANTLATYIDYTY